MAGMRFDEEHAGGHLYVREELNAALHLLRYWASAPGQTPERIRRAIRGLEQIQDTMAELEPELRGFYAVGQRAIAGDASAIVDRNPWWGVPRAEYAYFKWFYRLLPWERERAMRFLNAYVASNATALRQLRGQLEGKEPVQLRSAMEKVVTHWRETTITPAIPYGDWWASYRSVWVDNTTIRRATLIVLALQGWRLEHGVLPSTLDELAPSWLAEVPIDPVAGAPFQYFPDGTDETMIWSDGTWGFTKFTLPPHRPYLEAHCAERSYVTADTSKFPGYVPRRCVVAIPVSK